MAMLAKTLGRTLMQVSKLQKNLVLCGSTNCLHKHFLSEWNIYELYLIRRTIANI